MIDDEPFTPESVDEQVEQLSSPAQDESSGLNARVVQHLHALYEEDQRSTARVWERLARQVDVYDSDTHHTTKPDHDARHSRPVHGRPQEETHQVPQRKRPSTARTLSWLAPLAAVLCTALLVSSLLWVLQSLHASRTTLSTNSSAGIYLNETDGIAKLDSQTHRVIWHTTIMGRSQFDARWAPTVIGKTVYTYAGGSLLAFNAQTGASLWSRTLTGDIIAAPTLADGQLYALTRSSTFVFYAVQPTSGAIITTTPLPMVPQAWALGPQAPTVWHQVLYYSDPTHLYAMQLPSAEPLWQRQIFPTPTLPSYLILGPLFVMNGVVYVTTRSLANAPRYVFAIDARTGQQIWRSPAFYNGFNRLAVTNTLIYVSGQDVSALSPDDIHAFDAHTHRLVWQRSLTGELNTVAADANALYIESSTHSSGNHVQLAFIALNASHGQTLWQKQDKFFSSAYIQGDILGTSSGTLYIDEWNGNKGRVFALTPSNGSLLWQMPIGDGQTQWGITVVDSAGQPF